MELTKICTGQASDNITHKRGVVTESSESFQPADSQNEGRGVSGGQLDSDDQGQRPLLQSLAIAAGITLCGPGKSPATPFYFAD